MTDGGRQMPSDEKSSLGPSDNSPKLTKCRNDAQQLMDTFKIQLAYIRIIMVLHVCGKCFISFHELNQQPFIHTMASSLMIVKISWHNGEIILTNSNTDCPFLYFNIKSFLEDKSCHNFMQFFLSFLYTCTVYTWVMKLADIEN